MQPTVTVVGEALIDIVVPTSGPPREHIGGSPTNVAIGLARLEHPTRLVTCIGADERGQRIQAALHAEGIEVIASSDAAIKTSTATARLNRAAAASYEFELAWHFDPERLGGVVGGHFHTGSIAAMLSPGAEGVAIAMASAREGATVSYDPNIRPTLMGSAAQARPNVERLVALADVVKASAEDVEWLYPGKPLPQVMADWARLGPAVVAITAGSDDTIVLVGGALDYRRPLPSAVVDTVGAGDSFMAGLISGLWDGGYLGGPTARERLRFAHFDHLAAAVDRALACAAITVSRPGADPPTRAELQIDDV